MGAVPISKIDRSFWSDETGKALYVKGNRIDINGWLSPYWARKGNFLKNGEKERYGSPRKPMAYKDYISLFNIDEYTKTNDPLQYAVMAFALEDMLMKGVKIKNCSDIIKIYEANIGLEDRALPLLKECVNSDQAMELYNKYHDARLLDIFPLPRPNEDRYIQFLHTLIEKEPNKGWSIFYILYNMDRVKYSELFRDFVISHAHDISNPHDRIGAYHALIEIGDDISLKFLAASLLSDPVTECREAIVNTALTKKLCSKELIQGIAQLAKGYGDQHTPITPSRMVDQWHHILREYLIWAKDNDLCDLNTRTNAKRAFELLMR